MSEGVQTRDKQKTHFFFICKGGCRQINNNFMKDFRINRSDRSGCYDQKKDDITTT